MMTSMREIAAELTKLTGELWESEPANNSQNGILARKRDGLRLMGTTDYTGKGSIRLYLTKEQWDTHRTFSDPEIPSIGNSWQTRSAESVAKDIARRLIGNATDVHNELSERVSAHKAHEEETQRTRDALGLHFTNGTANYMPAESDAWARDIRVSGDSVNMELSSLNNNQAWAVLTILKLNTAEEIRDYFQNL